MWVGQQVMGVGEPAVELVPDQFEFVWGVVLLVVLVAAVLAVGWLARRGGVFSVIAERDRRHVGWRGVAAGGAGLVVVLLLARAVGLNLTALWLHADAFLGAPLTIVIVAVGAYRLGQLRPHRAPAPHTVHERR